MNFKKTNILKKAWYVYHDGMIGLGPEIYNSIEDIPVVYADTVAKAKSAATEPYDWNLKYEDTTPTYLDLKARRAPEYDLYLFEGKERSKSYIERELAARAALDVQISKIKSYPDDALFYVQNGFVGNSVLWWQLNGGGYTTKLNKAQAYTKNEILTGFIPGREEDRIWLKSHIDENTTVVVDGQNINSEFCTTKY